MASTEKEFREVLDALTDAERARAEAVVEAVGRWLAGRPTYDSFAKSTTRERQRFDREENAWLRRGPGALRAALDAYREGKG